MINAMMALNGMPDAIKESPIGIAAYVGSGEASPIRAAPIIAMCSLTGENRRGCARNWRAAATFRAMLITRYGAMFRNSSTKYVAILSV
jgi:hypothetical protein